jgi:hypothetical protein
VSIININAMDKEHTLVPNTPTDSGKCHAQVITCFQKRSRNGKLVPTNEQFTVAHGQEFEVLAFAETTEYN